MKKRVRRNPTPKPLRVTIADATRTWPGLRPLLTRAAAMGVLTREGWLPGDAKAERAARAATDQGLREVLKRVGSPLSQLVLRARRRGVGASSEALAELMQVVPGWLQEALVRAWDDAPAPALMAMLEVADRQLAIATTSAILRTLLRYVDRFDGTPRRALDAIDARADATALQAISLAMPVGYETTAESGPEGRRVGAAVRRLVDAARGVRGALPSIVETATRAYVGRPAYVANVYEGYAETVRREKEFADLIHAAAACPELTP